MSFVTDTANPSSPTWMPVRWCHWKALPTQGATEEELLPRVREGWLKVGGARREAIWEQGQLLLLGCNRSINRWFCAANPVFLNAGSEPLPQVFLGHYSPFDFACHGSAWS